MLGYFPGSSQDEYPIGKVLWCARLFINQYLGTHGDYCQGYRANDWIASSDDKWWAHMDAYTSVRFKDILKEIGLAAAVLAVKIRVPLSTQNFLDILEHYDMDTCTFFPLVGEMGISPWEMQRVSELPVGEFSYAEHVPPFKEF